MRGSAGELAAALSGQAEAVCRHYLPAGERAGRYWLVGNTANEPGRSLFVRLRGPRSGPGAAGKWTDAATGEHGDLLDLIGACCRLTRFADVAFEARRFLGDPVSRPSSPEAPLDRPTNAARRLFDMAQHLSGTLAEAYLAERGIAGLSAEPALRFHPTCYYRASEGAPRQQRPALIAAVTDQARQVTAVHRTWLTVDDEGQVPPVVQRRALGPVLGHGVRFGEARAVAAAGEGIETVLSLRMVMPALPMVACLSAAHLGAFKPCPSLRRLYVLREDDPAGHHAFARLSAQAAAMGCEAIVLASRLGDFNDDLRRYGVAGLREILRPQLRVEERQLLPAGC